MHMRMHMPLWATRKMNEDDEDADDEEGRAQHTIACSPVSNVWNGLLTRNIAFSFLKKNKMK